MDLDLIISQMPATIDFVIDAHANHSKIPKGAVRRHDGKTPYWVHPVWCLTSMLQEARLPEASRIPGAQSLGLHDVLEDTTAPIPDWVDKQIVENVEDMTFDSFDQEKSRLPLFSPVLCLWKLYDKVSNLLDGTWMSPTKRKDYLRYTRELALRVEGQYGPLNITRLAWVLIAAG